MKHLDFLIAGCGGRGMDLTLHVIAGLEDVTVVGVCDKYSDRADHLSYAINEKFGYRPDEYTDFTEMLNSKKADAILIATPWQTHVDLACEAMRHGLAVAMEVGGAANEEECRRLIATQEETKAPFMMMENCCFDRDELLATSLARRGMLGRITYCHGAYSHDLRDEIGYGDLHRHYRLEHYLNRNCENYPTHEFGPIAKVIGIGRGNRMVSLVSMASAAQGMHDYVMTQPELDYLKDKEFSQGDIVYTTIKCENGELVTLCLDTTLPGYYTREFTLKGTKGMFNHDTNTSYIDGMDKELRHKDNAYEAYYDYLPALWKNVTPEILKAGHGGMDYFEFAAFVDCLREGKEMPVDVYDAATWMSITYLSEKSIANGGIPVECPDFTNGAYKTRPLHDVTDLGV